jgi:hypothetical protein
MGKKFSPTDRAKMFKPTYFFGYGSLLWPPGINGRNMNYIYNESDLIPARLTGFERNMGAFFCGRNFYGLFPRESATCNGVIFHIKDWYDYRALLNNEGATSAYRNNRVYWPEDVTSKITYYNQDQKIDSKYRIMALVCRFDGTGKGTVSPWYVERCYKYASKWGQEFIDEFLATGGMTMSSWNILMQKNNGRTSWSKGGIKSGGTRNLRTQM